MSSFVCLITGANRGIGRGLASHYLLRSDTTVVAAVRNPSSTTATSLQSLPAGRGSHLVIIQADSTDEASTKAGLESLQGHGIDHIDLVIANAGMSQTRMQPIIQANTAELEDMIRVNGLGVLILFRQALPLMQRASLPRFVYVSSITGSFGAMKMLKDMPLGLMGVSKAVGAYLTKRLAIEEEAVITFSCDPGPVRTDAYTTLRGEASPGDVQHPMTPAECADKMSRVIDGATKETHHERYFNYIGKEMPW